MIQAPLIYRLIHAVHACSMLVTMRNSRGGCSVSSMGNSSGSSMCQELRDPGGMAHLHQRVVCAIEHCLRLAHGIDLTGTCLLALIVVLDQEIAISMERHDV